jgi:hypothetical protein
MEAALAGFGVLYAIFWLFGAIVILSIAIDAARTVRQGKKTIELLEQQNRYLAAISSNVARLSLPPKGAAA